MEQMERVTDVGGPKETVQNGDIGKSENLRKHVTAVISNLEHVLQDLESVVTEMRDLVNRIDKVTNTIDIQYGIGDKVNYKNRPKSIRLRSNKSHTGASSQALVEGDTQELPNVEPCGRTKVKAMPPCEDYDYSTQSEISYVSDDNLSWSVRDNLMTTSFLTSVTTPEYFSVDDMLGKLDRGQPIEALGYDRWSEFPAVRPTKAAGDNISDMCSIEDMNDTSFAWDSHGMEFLEELHTKFDLSGIGHDDTDLSIGYDVMFDDQSMDCGSVGDLEEGSRDGKSVTRRFEPNMSLDFSRFSQTCQTFSQETIVSPCVVCKCEHAQKEDRKYCGVYEHEMESRLETATDSFDQESFSDVSECEYTCDIYDGTSIDNSRDYTPTYNREINTWTSYALVHMDNEDNQQETNSDILNDNVTTSSYDCGHFFYDVSETKGKVPSFTDEIIKTYDLTSADTVDVICRKTSKRRSLPDIINMTEKQGRYMATT